MDIQRFTEKSQDALQQASACTIQGATAGGCGASTRGLASTGTWLGCFPAPENEYGSLQHFKKMPAGN